MKNPEIVLKKALRDWQRSVERMEQALEDFKKEEENDKKLLAFGFISRKINRPKNLIF